MPDEDPFSCSLSKKAGAENIVTLDLQKFPGLNMRVEPVIQEVAIDGAPVHNLRRIEIVADVEGATIVKLEFAARVRGTVRTPAVEGQRMAPAGATP